MWLLLIFVCLSFANVAALVSAEEEGDLFRTQNILQCSNRTSFARGSCMLTAPTSYSFTTDNASACCTRCQETSGCRAWSIVYNDTAGGPWKGQSHCLIYSRAVPFAPGNCVSGIMRATPPPTPVKKTPHAARNVLMIIVDDLRPQLGAYGQTGMITPNIDRIGASGVVFSRAYCQISICGPSRTSFLTGRRPQRTQVWNFINTFRESHPDWATFPEYFKQYNYTTLGAGKTYHPEMPPYSDEPASWTQEEGYSNGAFSWPPHPGNRYENDPETIPVDVNPPTGDTDCLEWSGSFLCPWSNVTDDFFRDWRSMNVTRTRILKYASNKTRPFFLAYGAHRPHLPWSFPRRFWDMYPENISLPKYEEAPIGMPEVAFTWEMDGMVAPHALNRTEILPWPSADTAFSHNMTRTLRRGYYAAVSWCDFLIGKLLDTLDVAGIQDRTVVALVGDHGWQLGEHNIWGKHTNFELGTRVPFIISSPGSIMPGVSNALVELIDLYPTVASVAGLPPPSGLDGMDLSPLLNKTNEKHSSIDKPTFLSLKDAVFSEYPRCFLNQSTPWDGYIRPALGNRHNGWGNCMSTLKHHIRSMGYSVRTDAYRYNIWLPWDGERLQGDFDAQPLGVELYHHGGDNGTDFDAYENENVASDPQNAYIVKKLFTIARNQWDVVPPSPSPRCAGVLGGNFETDAQFVGENSHPLSHHVGTSVVDCCHKCGASLNCSYFTFFSAEGMCRFHGIGAQVQHFAGAISGALDGAKKPPKPIPAPPPPAPAPTPPPPVTGTCKVQSGVRYNGTLLGYTPSALTNTCCKQCSTTNDCVAFTFTPGLLRCAFFSSVTKVVDELSSISGNMSTAVA